MEPDTDYVAPDTEQPEQDFEPAPVPAMPQGVDTNTLARAIINMAQNGGQQQQPVQPEPYRDPLESEEYVQRLNAMMYENPGQYHREMRTLAQQEATRSFQPTLTANTNSAVVERDVINGLQGWAGELAPQLEGKAREYIARARQSNPEFFADPQSAAQFVTQALYSDAWQLQSQGQQRGAAQLQGRAPLPFGSSQGAPVRNQRSDAGITDRDRNAASAFDIPTDEFAKIRREMALEARSGR